MTYQVGDTLCVEGNEYEIHQCPLDQLGVSWKESQTIEGPVPRFFAYQTSCWRGYTATWSIEKAKLFLTKFDAKDYAESPLTIIDVFGSDRLFAFWFSGELTCPMEDENDAGYNPNYCQIRSWTFEHGLLTGNLIRVTDEPRRESEKMQVSWRDDAVTALFKKTSPL